MVHFANYVSLYFLYYFVTCVFAEDLKSKQYDACLTPERQTGTCVIINNCPKLLNLLKKGEKNAASPENLEYLKQSHCGFHLTRPKVCCSLNDTDEIGLSTTQQPVISVTDSRLSDPFPSKYPLISPDDCGFFIEERFSDDDDTNLDSYPWMVLLEYEKPNGRGFHCGGALINKRYVLTAAHCVSGKGIRNDWKLVSVLLGEYELNIDPDCKNLSHVQPGCCCAEPVINVTIEGKIVHEEYDPSNVNQYHDIALLRLAYDVTFSEFVRPVCLQPISQFTGKTRPGDVADIGGWGITNQRPQSNRKLISRVVIKNNTECESIYAQKGLRLREDQICALSFVDQNVCSGDSGGVLMNSKLETISSANYYAIGVMSFGHPACSQNEYPVVYTKVENYVPWIIGKLKP